MQVGGKRRKNTVIFKTWEFVWWHHTCRQCSSLFHLQYMQNAEYTQLQECLTCITLQSEDRQPTYYIQTLTRLSKTAHRQRPELWLNTWVFCCDNDRVHWWSLQSSLWQTNSTVGLHTIPLFIFAFQWLWFSFYKIKVHIEHTKISGHWRCSEKCGGDIAFILKEEFPTVSTWLAKWIVVPGKCFEGPLSFYC